MKLTLAEGKELVGIAKKAVEGAIYRREIKISDNIKKKYSSKRGVFATLMIEGELRGCIGYPEPTESLWKAVADSAQNAAVNDPRFPPVSEEELSRIAVEVSVLTAPELIEVENSSEYPDKVKIGEDGLIVEKEYFKGLLLPQVFPEFNADSSKALSMTCEKAGLPSDCWKEKGVKFYKFQAQIFSEEDGKIVEKSG